MITNPIEAKKYAVHICKEVLALAKYHNKEALINIQCGDFEKAKSHQDIVDAYIAMLECLETLENEEES